MCISDDGIDMYISATNSTNINMSHDSGQTWYEYTPCLEYHTGQSSCSGNGRLMLIGGSVGRIYVYHSTFMGPAMGPTGPRGPNCPQKYCQYDLSSGNVTIFSGSLVPYKDPIVTTLPGYNTSTYQFTAPVDGYYFVKATISTTVNNANNSHLMLNIRVNSISLDSYQSVSSNQPILLPSAIGKRVYSVSSLVYLLTGHYVDIYFVTDTDGLASPTGLLIERYSTLTITLC